MSFFGKWIPVLLAAALLAVVSGCSPMDQGAMDEEKEPHYVLGKSRVNAFNYIGAIEAFEESLEANPHSALAHYQLAMLFENQESDPAAAIYHYQQYLKYNPKAANAEIIAQHITRCKQQLAEDSLTLPSTPAAQQQLEKLMDENRQLHTQLSQWQAAYFALKTNPPVAPVNNVAPQNNYLTQPQANNIASGGATTATTTPARTTATTIKPAPAPQKAATSARTHTVVRNETLASIARNQNISLPALQAANPGVNPKKLKAGQVLNLPPP